MHSLVHLILVVILAWNIPLHAQWKEISKPLSPYAFNSVTQKGTRLIGSCAIGIVISDDNGSSWTSVSSSLSITGEIVNMGSTLFANGGTVLTSNDNGSSWSSTGNEMSSVQSIATIDTVLFASTSINPGLKISKDKGQTWQNSGLATEYITKLLAINDTLYAGTNVGLYISADTGKTWNWTFFGDQYIRSMANDGSKLYVSISPIGLYVKNASNSMDLLGAFNYINKIAVKGNELYIYGSSNQVFAHSSDNGSNWVYPKLPSQALNSTQDFALTDSGLYAATGSGLYFTTDNANHWNSASENLGENTLVYTVKKTHAGILFGAEKGLYQYSNLENKFQFSGLNGLKISDIIERNSDIYVAAGSEVYHSVDSGKTWLATGTPSYGGKNILAMIGSYIYVGGGQGSLGLRLSMDKGQTWSDDLGNGMWYGSGISSISVIEDSLFVLDGYGNLYTSNTYGEFWTKIATGHNAGYDLRVANDILYLSTYDTTFRSTDLGHTWSMVPELGKNSTGNNLNCIVSKDSVLFAGTYFGIFVSLDNGLHWQRAMDGLKSTSLYETYSLEISGDTLYAATNSGVFSARLKTIIPPKAPKSLIVMDSLNQKVTLNWNKNKEADFYKYRIYAGTNAGSLKLLDSVISGISDTFIILNGLRNREKYYFQVTAVDSFNCESKPSNIISATIIDTEAPEPPMNDSITNTSFNNFTVKLQKSASIDVLRYRIYLGLSPNNLVLKDSIEINNTEKVFDSLWAEHTYYVGISTVDSSYNQSQMTVISALATHNIMPASTNIKNLYIGHLKIGDTVEYDYNITNLSDDTLKISEIISTDPSFVPLDTAFMIPTMSSVNTKFHFSPKKIGNILGNIIITSNTETRRDTLMQIKAIGYGEGKLSYNKFIDIGRVMINQTVDTVIEWANIGNDTFRIQSINYDNKLRLIPPGEAIKDTIKIITDQLGKLTGYRLAFSNGYQNTDSITITGYVYGIGILSVQPQMINFGTINLNKNYGQVFYTENTGTDTVKIASMYMTQNKFQVTEYLHELAPYQNYGSEVKIVPTSIGQVNDTLIITSNSPEIIDTIVLTAFVKGEPQISVNPSIIDIGDVIVGLAKDTSFTVTNTGTDTLFISKFEYNTNTINTDELYILEANMVILPSESRDFTLRYVPIRYITWNTGLGIFSNASDNPIVTVNVNGSGVIPINIQKNLKETENALGTYPNPFSKILRLEFTLQVSSYVQITVHDLSGKKVTSVYSGYLSEGIQKITWNGIHSEGPPLATGVYLLRMTVNEKGKDFPKIIEKNILLIR